MTTTQNTPSIGTQIAIVEYQIAELKTRRNEMRNDPAAVNVLSGEKLELEGKLATLKAQSK